ncbi:MAG TPA: 7TM domain-containing protein [Candidatus Saccharimonadales bacterium]|nr:7TM domain-containing protein [Candidatus Saccharimonadales bacterium]
MLWKGLTLQDVFVTMHFEMYKKIIFLACIVFLSVFAGTKASKVLAENLQVTPSITATTSATPTVTQTTPVKVDVTKPDNSIDQQIITTLFVKRPALKLTIFNFFAYFVQYAVRIGVPANTIVLILLLPLLATIVAFVRHVIGLPSLGMLVAVSFSITFLTIGIAAGMILLGAIVLASTFARIILKKVRIMQLPKMALSILVVAVFVLIALVVSGTYGLITVKDLSIFPVLLLILLGERVVALQLERNIREVISITFITLVLGVMGFFLLAYVPLRNTVLLYPESILLLIPINIAVGRYFGLRLVEYYRFRQIINHGSK